MNQPSTPGDRALRADVIGGVTTFFTMAYIVVVNPSILSTPGTGMPFSGALTATVLVASSMTLLMGLYARLPFAVAPLPFTNGDRRTWFDVIVYLALIAGVAVALVAPGVHSDSLSAVLPDNTSGNTPTTSAPPARAASATAPISPTLAPPYTSPRPACAIASPSATASFKNEGSFPFDDPQYTATRLTPFPSALISYSEYRSTAHRIVRQLAPKPSSV